jgi:hypothetical protein
VDIQLISWSASLRAAAKEFIQPCVIWPLNQSWQLAEMVPWAGNPAASCVYLVIGS